MAISNTGYQAGTTAAASMSRRVLAYVMPQVQGSFNDPAVLTTSGPANSNIKYTAATKGSVGNSVTIAYVVAGASTPLTVSVSGNAITVNVATNGSSAATSTGAQVLAAIQASAPAAALVGSALATGNDGTGVVAAMAATPMLGGRDFVQGGISNAPLPKIPNIHFQYA